MRMMILLIFLCSVLKAQSEISGRTLVGCSATLSEEQKTAFCSHCRLWPGNIIPYNFDEDTDSYMQAQARFAMNALEEIANLKFVFRTDELNYLRFYDSDGNSSPVGVDGGKNRIRIYNWDYPFIIVHEILHSLGFWHEQSRPDRDQYIIVKEDNICSGKGHNFDVEHTGVTRNIPYDFASIMHYGAYAFSKCLDGSDCNDGCEDYTNLGPPTIQVQPDYEQFRFQIGQRVYLSRSDKLMTSFVYPYSHYRFVNKLNEEDDGDGKQFYTAVREFSVDFIQSLMVSKGNQVWVMPGTYSKASGVYDKPITVEAPYGDVVFK